MSGQSSALLVSCGGSVRAFTLGGEEVAVPSDAVYDGVAATTARWYPNGRLLAVGTSSGAVAFHHHDKLDVIGHFSAASGARPPSAITCVDVTSGSRFLAAGTDSGELNIWDMKSSNIVNRFAAPGPVAAVSFQHSADSRYVACAAGPDVFVYSRASGRLVDTFTVAGAAAAAAPASPGAAATGTAALARTPSAARARVTAAAFSPHSVNLLAATDDGGCVTVWDVSRARAGGGGAKVGTDGAHARFTAPLRTPATGLEFAGAASALVGLLVCGLDKHVRVYDRALRQLLLSFACGAPVAAVALSPDAAHVAAGYTTGAIGLFALDAPARAATLVATVAHAPSPRADAARPPALGAAVRALHFQPRVAPAPDGAAASTPKVPRPARDPPPGAAPGARWRDAAPAVRAKTSPSPSLMSGMLLPVVERTADDSLLRGAPRDSDIFSPMVRAPQSARGFSVQSPESNALARSLDYRRGDAADPDVSATFPSSIPVVFDRRMSDLIPATAPSRPPFAKAQDTSRSDPDPRQGSILDGDVAESLLGSSPAESFGTSGARSDFPVSGALDMSKSQSSSLYSSGLESNSENERVKATSLPRGQAFRRLRKSASEVSPRKQLPPLQPRSNTTTNLKDASKEAVSTDRDPSTSIRAHTESQSVDIVSSGFEDEPGKGPKTPMGSEAQELEAALSTTPLQRKSEVSNGYDKQTSEIAKVVKQTIVAEIDSLRVDFRNDIVNIHSELILSYSRTTREMKQMFVERDHVIAQLQKEVAELRKANTRLQEMYIDE